MAVCGQEGRLGVSTFIPAALAYAYTRVCTRGIKGRTGVLPDSPHRGTTSTRDRPIATVVHDRRASITFTSYLTVIITSVHNHTLRRS